MWSRSRKRGIAIKRVAVRTHVPWYRHVVVIVALLVAVAGLAYWAFDAGRRAAGYSKNEATHDVEVLQDRIVALEKQLYQLKENPEGGDSRLQIERAAQQQLVSQVKSLEQENARLKEDLALFENLASVEGKDGQPSVNRLRVEPDAVPGQFRYRLLLALQGGQKDREFRGALQLLVTLQQQGRSVIMIIPSTNDADRQRFNISFRHFKRVDGQFQVPLDAQVKSVEVRLLQNGATKASQTVVL